MCPLWHSKHSAVTNVHLACKVCVQERLHFLYESSWNTPAAVSANKSPNLTGTRRCLHSRVLEFHPFIQWKGFLIEGVQWRHPLTRDPSQKPPGCLHNWSGPHFQHQSRVYVMHRSARPSAVTARWARSGGFVDAAVRTTHEKRSLSPRWLTKRGVFSYGAIKTHAGSRKTRDGETISWNAAAPLSWPAPASTAHVE